jgi:hypothetical protein
MEYVLLVLFFVCLPMIARRFGKAFASGVTSYHNQKTVNEVVQLLCVQSFIEAQGEPKTQPNQLAGLPNSERKEKALKLSAWYQEYLQKHISLLSPSQREYCRTKIKAYQNLARQTDQPPSNRLEEILQSIGVQMTDPAEDK